MADGVHPGALVAGATGLAQQLRQHIEPEPGRCASLQHSIVDFENLSCRVSAWELSVLTYSLHC